jgi:hypothetical protein
MNKRAVFFLVAANLVVLLLIAVVWPEHMVAPGQVMPAHRAFATDCFACHQPFIGSTPGQCVKCHKPAEIGLVTTKGVSIADELKFPPFHQDLTEQDCVACHSDHKGVQVFHPIGRFSHGLLKVARRDQCSGCHQAPLDSMHQGVVGNCGQCHGQEAWTPATFDHERLFSLAGDHEAACNTCHVGNDYSRYTCYGCHEHTRSGIREEHLEEGIRDYENCVECHRGGDAEDAEHAAGRREGRDAGDGDNRADQPSGENHDSDEQDDDDDDD